MATIQERGTPTANQMTGVIWIHEARHVGIRGVSPLPGGVSGALRQPSLSQPAARLADQQRYPLLDRESDQRDDSMSVTQFVPKRD